MNKITIIIFCFIIMIFGTIMQFIISKVRKKDKKKAFLVAICGIGGDAIICGIALKVNEIASSVSMIGGADGPTAIFVAGKVSGDIPLALIAGGGILALAGLVCLWISSRKQRNKK